MHNSFSLAGKHALITGGTRGIGLAIAETFAAAGARVTVCSRKENNVEAAVAAVQQHGEAYGVAGDVGSTADIERIADTAAAKFGPVQILVNNAGTNRYFGPIEDISEANWDHTLDVNLKGPFLLAQRVGKQMIAAGIGGSIINIASTAGLQAAIKMGVYSVSKAALIMLTKVLAREWGRFGVRVNCICPGLVQTELSEALWSDAKRREAILAMKALRRLGQPSELAGAALYLASDASSFTTGAILQVDGGMVI